ncbi:MAG: DUF357 domain-containing protein [Candidatus Nanoarchaeia archaeon]
MELDSQLEKEYARTVFAFKELSVTDSQQARELYELVKSYYDDALHFYNKGLKLESFELFAYVWGLLDAGARLGLFDPGAARQHYKIEQHI